MNSAQAAYRFEKPSVELIALPLRSLHALISAPVATFLATMTALLFRPPNLKSIPVDRIAVIVLMLVLGLRFLIRREHVRIYPSTWPLLGLFALGLWGALGQPYDSQTWSVLVAKWVVPLVFFHISGVVFQSSSACQKLETFLLIVLLYLSVIAVLSLFGGNDFIFPRYISDESIGIHFDRARGPFLQAVANGVCLNMLGVIALDSFRRHKVPRALAGVLFLAAFLALLATKTRSVWISAAMSVILIIVFVPDVRMRRAAFSFSAIGAIAAALFLVYGFDRRSFAERTYDQSPVEFRSEMYRAGWQMFTEKPFIGWGNKWQIQPEVEKRVTSFHPEYHVFHNTFLEVAVEHGILGLALYLWLIICLFRLSRPVTASVSGDTPFSNAHFLRLWPLLLVIYLINANAVVMNYQFVNALLFTIAGVLAAQSVPPSFVRDSKAIRA